MSGAPAPVSPLLLERYELKYVIPSSLVEPISEYVESFCDMDYYSTISPEGFYTINSLYFETPRNYFFRAKEAQPNHLSLRVRSYGHNPKPPYYFETKTKINGFMKKRRGKVPIENWSDVLLDPFNLKDYDPDSDPHVRHFRGLVINYNAHPKILTQYKRRAYLSTIDDYARVTFDRDMKYCPEERYNVHPVEREMLNYDHPFTFEDRGKNVVLELKCERKIPVWFVDLIKRFDLCLSGFSKFENGMLEAFSTQGLDDFSTSRIPAPFNSDDPLTQRGPLSTLHGP